jgi:hypothetical protein
MEKEMRRKLKWYQFEECEVKNNHGKIVTIPEGIHSVADFPDLLYVCVYLNDKDIDISHQQFSLLKLDGKVKLIDR